MKTILFQGDSITDAWRSPDCSSVMGSGYVTMVAGRIGVDYPGKYNFVNRGVGGNRSVDLYARIQNDVLNVKPDILTVLIGVNDVWHGLELQNGISEKKYEKILELFVQEVLEELPDVKIFFMEPFALCGSGNSKYYNAFMDGVKQRAAACKRVAERYNIAYIPLQDKMDALAEKAGSEYVLFDGVHPSAVGHELIARELYAAMKSVL